MELLIVTGMSGAGKSLALKSLEDMGFFCVDNLPSPMLKEFISMCKNANPPIRHAAVTMDSREGLLSRSPETVLKEIKKIDVPYTILFLDARDDVLKRRYNETRKRHPLGVSGEAESGVRTERGFLSFGMRRISFWTPAISLRASFPRAWKRSYRRWIRIR